MLENKAYVYEISWMRKYQRILFSELQLRLCQVAQVYENEPTAYLWKTGVNLEILLEEIIMNTQIRDHVHAVKCGCVLLGLETTLV